MSNKENLAPNTCAFEKNSKIENLKSKLINIKEKNCKLK